MTRTQLAEQEYPHFTEAQAIEIGVPLETLNERQSIKRKAYLKGLERSPQWIAVEDDGPPEWERYHVKMIHPDGHTGHAYMEFSRFGWVSNSEDQDEYIVTHWLDEPTG